MGVRVGVRVEKSRKNGVFFCLEARTQPLARGPYPLEFELPRISGGVREVRLMCEEWEV